MSDRRAAAVSAAMAKVRHLAMLPETATRIVQLANDPSSSVQQMSDLIATSPELCTRVLKVVNSALYGLPGMVGSVDRAISLIGLAAVKNVAIAASLTRTFEGPRLSARFAPRDLWSHSLAVATAAQAIARTVRAPVAEDAFLAGLLHDVGLMVELQADRRAFAAVLKTVESDASVDMLAAECEAFHADHQDLGEALLTQWNLPRPLRTVAGWHHRPLAAPRDDRALTTLVHVADRLVQGCSPPFALDDADPSVADDVCDELRLTAGQLDALRASLPPAVEEARSLLSV